jgi:cyanophycinase
VPCRARRSLVRQGATVDYRAPVRRLLPPLLLLGCVEPPAETPTPTPTPEPDLDPPEGLERWLTGDEADAQVAVEPALLLLGGGLEPDDSFAAWLQAAPGGDVVVVRASGGDGYNDWIVEDLGGVDSVETLRVDERRFADDPWVAQRVRRAELVWIAGGDQGAYRSEWEGTALAAELSAATALGGTSAGLAILGEVAYTADNGTVLSDEALADPYDERVTLTTGLLDRPRLAGVVTDSHFAERDRMGRLAAFVARAETDGLGSVLGLGLDEETALLIRDGVATVWGPGAVYAVAATDIERCEAGQPLEASFELRRLEASFELRRLEAGDALALPDWTGGSATTLTASGGALSPADPY